jgi:hypothetical protein
MMKTAWEGKNQLSILDALGLRMPNDSHVNPAAPLYRIKSL